MTDTRQLLDRVQSLAKIVELEAHPRSYAELLATEAGTGTTLADLEQRDEILRRALVQIDAASERVMRILLDDVLAGDTSIGAPTRKVFASTIITYAGRIELLATRAQDVASRGGAVDAGVVAALVVDAARRALALRDALRLHVLALIAEYAKTAVSVADVIARDRRLDDPARRRASAMRRELDAIAAQPQRIVAAPILARLNDWPDQLDEPDPGSEPTFADMIELD